MRQNSVGAGEIRGAYVEFLLFLSSRLFFLARWLFRQSALTERLAKATVLPANKLTKPSSLFQFRLQVTIPMQKGMFLGGKFQGNYQHTISTTTLTPLDKNCGEVTRVVILGLSGRFDRKPSAELEKREKARRKSKDETVITINHIQGSCHILSV